MTVLNADTRGGEGGVQKGSENCADVISVTPSPALGNLPHDDGVEDDERGVGHELHDDHLAPEGVVVLVDGVQPQRRLPDRSLVREREHVRLELKELEEKKSQNGVCLMHNCRGLRTG